MFDDFLRKSAELVAEGKPFAVATVVRAEAPTSGKPGDKAIIHPDGRLWGWIGGGCAQPVVVKEALKALKEGRGRLIRISPSPDGEEEGVVDYAMTCHSGGSLDIYIDPVLPKAQIVILGRSPVAQALARLSDIIGYAVIVVSQESAGENYGNASLLTRSDYALKDLRDGRERYVVVSSQGEDDEEALRQAINTGAEYIAFVASKTKADKVLEFLRQQGIAKESLAKVRAPAGLRIAAASPQEIAVSILAEIIQVRGRKKTIAESKPAATLSVLSTDAKDPICGMAVDISRAKHKTEFAGTMFYFCCAGCKQSFEQQPEKYVSPK